MPLMLVGAAILMETCMEPPGPTVWATLNGEPPMAAPPMRMTWNPGFQAQVPLFATCHVLVNTWAGVISVLSGIVTSLTKRSPRHAGVDVATWVLRGLAEGAAVLIRVEVGKASAVSVRLRTNSPTASVRTRSK